MFKLYDFSPSGNCYKVRLLLNQLNIPFTRVPINITQGESRNLKFLSINPNGRVPVLEIKKGQFLAESNAILFYLSTGTKFLPSDKFAQAKVMQWLFFEQYSHEPYIATSRYWLSILNKGDEHQAELQAKQKLGYFALSVMEEHLTNHIFFVEESYTIADIALFAYTHVADEGGFNLTKFPAVQAWIKRIESQSNYISLTS